MHLHLNYYHFLQQTTKKVSSFETCFYIVLQIIIIQKKYITSSNKVISVLAAKYRKNSVAAKVFLKFIGLETLIIHKSIHLIKNLIIIFQAKLNLKL